VLRLTRIFDGVAISGSTESRQRGLAVGDEPDHDIQGRALSFVGCSAQRLSEFGPNEIRRERGVSSLTLFVRQFASPVIWLLLGAATVSVLLRELVDAITIGAIVVINAVIGFLQGASSGARGDSAPIDDCAASAGRPRRP
jgi:magnesium-transporting ATPase (P-type)